MTLPTVNGNAQIVSEGVAALERLASQLNEGYEIAEIAIWENTPITAKVFDGFVFIDLGWNGKDWTEV